MHLDENRKKGAKALGWDPQSGWGPGLGVNSLPGAPGWNDRAIYAERLARDRNLNPQQFGMHGPDRYPRKQP